MKRYTLLSLLFLLALSYSAIGQSLTEGEEGFEEWEGNEVTEKPVGWSSSGFGSGRMTGVEQGSSAAAVWNWYAYAVGILSIGEHVPLWFDIEHAGVPIDYFPAKLVGYYKYEPGLNKGRGEGSRDSGIVFIMLKRWNPEKMGVDTISFISYQFPETPEWQRFEVDIPRSKPGLIPDSIAVVFYSTHPERVGFCGPDTMNCCYLSIDNLALVATSGVPYALDDLLKPAQVMPNPLREDGIITFSAEAGRDYHIRIFDAGGREVAHYETTEGEFRLRREEFDSGTYQCVVLDDSGKQIARGKFVVY